MKLYSWEHLDYPFGFVDGGAAFAIANSREEAIEKIIEAYYEDRPYCRGERDEAIRKQLNKTSCYESDNCSKGFVIHFDS